MHPSGPLHFKADGLIDVVDINRLSHHLADLS
jgi:hypothetical protein